jgi:hydroxymethylpyrimidine pyrophosphatase-like HAD family hydrolase
MKDFIHNKKPKTIICDIDGTIVFHHGNLTMQFKKKPELLDGSIEKLNEWDSLGYNIVLITGRRESMRKETERHLESLGVFYDQLIMGVGGGARIVINDLKPNSDKKTAFAINVKRNTGIKDIEV